MRLQSILSVFFSTTTRVVYFAILPEARSCRLYDTLDILARLGNIDW